MTSELVPHRRAKGATRIRIRVVASASRITPVCTADGHAVGIGRPTARVPRHGLADISRRQGPKATARNVR
jgi:hypothetical protein